MRSLQSHLLLLRLLSLAAVSLLLVQISAQASRAEAVVERACQLIAGRCGFHIAGKDRHGLPPAVPATLL